MPPLPSDPPHETSRRILDALTDGVVAVDAAGRVAHANAAAHALFGYATDELTGRSAAALFPEWPPAGGGVAEMLWSGVRKDGSPLGLAVRRLDAAAAAGPLTLVVLREAAGPARAEEAALSRDHLARIVDIAEDGVVTADGRGRVVLFNQGAENIFGYTAGEMLGRPLDRLLPERFAAEHARQMAEFAWSSKSARRMGERRAVFGRRKDGTEFPAEVSISKLPTPGGMLFTAIVRDVTGQKEAEAAVRRLNEELERRVLERTADLRAKGEELTAMTQQLWQAAKLASVGELAASIAHELNNPLATVSLRLEAVLARTPADDPDRRSLEVVEQEVERMANLVANLLQFSRRAPDQVSTVHVPEELDKSLELVEHHLRHRGIAVARDVRLEAPTIFADRQKLRQVFLNLLTNAADAMPQGGTLHLRASLEVAADGAKVVRIEFSDTGVGIAPEHLPRVTEPFFTTKAEGKGTGLGLAICRRVVEEHRGTMQVHSEVGKGTTVSLILPVASAANADRLRGR